MAWGILEPSSRPLHVPGTVLLESDFQTESNTSQETLKTTLHRGETIVLVPQPSDDPNDPLNWPLWQRDALLFLYATATIAIVGGIGPIISPIAFELTQIFKVSFTDVSLLSGYSLLATACFGIIAAPLAHKLGKRLPLLVSIACAFAGSLWGGYANSYNSLLGARIVQGLGVSMFESLNYVIVGDLYFVHQRGVRVALVSNSIIGVGALPPVIAGKVATELGWRWVFWLLAIFVGIIFIWAIFFGFESAYVRDAAHNTDTNTQQVQRLVEGKPIAEHTDYIQESGSLDQTEYSRSTRSRKLYVSRLKPWSGTYSSTPFWRLVIQMFLVVTNPVAIWAVLLFSFPVIWLVAFNLLIAQIFAGPPFLLNTAQLGYMSTGSVVGGVVSALFCGAVSDPLVKYLARKNKGIHEPEFRLLLLPLALVLTLAAYFPFGYMIRDGKSPAAISAMYGVATASAQVLMSMVGSYIVDAYRDQSIEVFMLTMVVKNFLFYGFSYFVNDWLARWGPVKYFCAVGGIQVGLCATTIALYVFGKKLRFSWYGTAAAKV